MAENFSNFGKESEIQVQEAQQVSNKMNPKRPTPRRIVIKEVKVKETMLKKAREKGLVIYKGNHVRLSADFSEATIMG